MKFASLPNTDSYMGLTFCAENKTGHAKYQPEIYQFNTSCFIQASAREKFLF